MNREQKHWIGTKATARKWCRRCRSETLHACGSRYWFCVSLMGTAGIGENHICGANNYPTHPKG